MRSATPNKTLLAAAALVIAGSFLLKMSPPAGKILIGLGLLIMAFEGALAGIRPLLSDARDDVRSIKHAFQVRKRLWLRRARQATTPSATVRIGWQLLVGFMMLVLISGGLGFADMGTKTAIATTGHIIVTVALFDLCVMGFGVMRWPWARSTGKWLKAAVAAVLAGIALSMARQTVSSLTGEDPSRFPATLAVLTGLYIPFAWATIAAVIAFFILVPAMVLSFCRMLVSKPRNTPDGHLLGRCAASLRPVFLTLALFQVGLIASPPDLTKHPLVRYAGIVLLLNMDFWEQPACGKGSVIAARVADTRYLYVDAADKALTLHTMACFPSV